MNYDPNICRNFATHTIKLTFGQWDYRAEIIVTVGGNCSGLDVIKSAVNKVYNDLTDNGDGPEIMLTRPRKSETDEDYTLTIAEEDEGSDFLADMLISAEITALKPEEEDA